MSAPSGDDPAATTPARTYGPINTNTKFPGRTSFKTIARVHDPTPSRARGMGEVRDRAPSLVSDFTFDATSFLPQPTGTDQPSSGTSSNPTTTTDRNVPGSTSNAGATPGESSTNGQGSKKPSTAVVALLAVIGAIVVLAAGIYLGRKHYKKRKANTRLENVQLTTPEASANSHEPRHSPRRHQHYISRRLSELFFTPSSRVTLESIPSRWKRDPQFPARETQGTNAPFRPAGERIPMRDLLPSVNRQRMESLDPSPLNLYPYMATSSPRRGHVHAPHQTTTTIGSLINYYQDSGHEAKAKGYELVSPGSPTPGQATHETAYQESIYEDLEAEPELKQDQRSMRGHADDFEPAITYGQGYSDWAPNPHPRPNMRQRDIDGTTSTSSWDPTPTLSETVFSDPHHVADFSDMTSETTHSPFLEALEERYGPADGTETGSLAGAIRSTEKNPSEPAMQSRLDALAELEYSSRCRNNKARGNEGGESTVVRQDSDPRLDTSRSNISDLRPNPLHIRKTDSPPYHQNSGPGHSRNPEQRTGYEEYTGNPYASVRSDRDNTSTEEHTPLHVRGSYENWAREQRRERSERAAGYRCDGRNTGALNYTRGESSGTQPRRPLYPLAEHTEDDFNTIRGQRQARAQADEYDAYAEVGHGDRDHGEIAAVQDQDTDRRGSREWYHRIRDRLRTQTPDSSRLSKVYRGTRASDDKVDKGKGVVD